MALVTEYRRQTSRVFWCSCQTDSGSPVAGGGHLFFQAPGVHPPCDWTLPQWWQHGSATAQSGTTLRTTGQERGTQLHAGPHGWAYPHEYVSPILNSLRVVSLNIGLRATTVVNADSLLGICMCTRKVDVTNYVVQTTVWCCSSLIPFTPGQRAESDSRWCWRASLLLSLLYCRLSSFRWALNCLQYLCIRFHGLPSSSILRRFFHHERKRKKEGTRAAWYVNYA